MGKILSICIPSYNMEKYLDRSVGSLLVPEVLDKLEIIIVNDGSKDSTLAIANKYKEQYPQSVVVIDKPNGHYGSTVNAALKIATGKYFRILDADDWFDRDGLVQFVARLEELDVDCVYTHYTKQIDGNPVPQFVVDLPYNHLIALDTIVMPSECLVMHSLTYKTNLLRDIDYRQTEGICYTDTEYVYYPLIKAKTIYFTPIYLYQYFVGRDDQSMSTISMARCRAHLVKILDRILKSESLLETDNLSSMKRFECGHLMKMILYAYLILNKPTADEESLLRSLLLCIKEFSLDVFTDIINQTRYKIPIYKLWYNSRIIAWPILAVMRKKPLK